MRAAGTSLVSMETVTGRLLSGLMLGSGDNTVFLPPHGSHEIARRPGEIYFSSLIRPPILHAPPQSQLNSIRSRRSSNHLLYSSSLRRGSISLEMCATPPGSACPLFSRTNQQGLTQAPRGKLSRAGIPEKRSAGDKRGAKGRRPRPTHAITVFLVAIPSTTEHRMPALPAGRAPPLRWALLQPGPLLRCHITGGRYGAAGPA